MKTNGKAMVAVAMLVGILGAVGCAKPNAQDTGLATPEETAATATVEDAKSTAANPGVEQDWRIIHYHAPWAPPMPLYENRGHAPSERHFWAPGYWRWNGYQHVWFGGRWEQRRDSYEYVAPHWIQIPGGRFEYVPGHWVPVRRGWFARFGV